MKRLVSFGFQGTNSQIVGNALDQSCYILDNSVESIDQFIHTLTLLQPKQILGLGSYNGRDQDRIRIESLSSNRFRKKLNSSELDFKGINFFVLPGDTSKISKGLGNSFCNYVCYQIMNLIENKVLESQFTFLHLPQKIPTAKLIVSVKNLLNEKS